jgi:hypothetical protein
MPLLRFICKERPIFQILGPSRHDVGNYGLITFVVGAENDIGQDCGHICLTLVEEPVMR